MESVRVFGGNGKIWNNVDTRGHLIEDLSGSPIVFWLAPPVVGALTPSHELVYTHVVPVTGTTDKWLSNIFEYDGIQVEKIKVKGSI